MNHFESPSPAPGMLHTPGSGATENCHENDIFPDLDCELSNLNHTYTPPAVASAEIVRTLKARELTYGKTNNIAVNHTDLSGYTVSVETSYRGMEQSPNEPAPAPLRIDCTCEDGFVWWPTRGGNDPDGKMLRCEVPDCDDGVVPVTCDACNCNGFATDKIDGTYACEHCAPVLRAELVADALAALTSWNRSLAGHHMRLWLSLPSGSLEMGEIGREIVEDGLAEWFRLPRQAMVRIAMEAAA